MKEIYEIICSVDLAKAVEPISEIVESMNNHLSTMGYSERLRIGSEFALYALEVSRPLSDNELVQITVIIKQEVEPVLMKMNENKFRFEFVGLRRKSCSKSFSQPSL